MAQSMNHNPEKLLIKAKGRKIGMRNKELVDIGGTEVPTIREEHRL